MHISDTNLQGVWVVEPEPICDDRGFFARTFCEREFAAKGLETRFVQHSMSMNTRAGTLRGLHFQFAPFDEDKLVTCIKGAVLDVVVDLRADSSQYCNWLGLELTAENRRSLYVPKGFAHGYQTLQDNVEMRYLISEFYQPGASSGLRYDDPAFAIDWPLPVSVISEKDRSWPNFHP